MKSKKLLGKEIKEGGFKKAYHSLPYRKLNEGRKEICDMCFWTEGNFRAKLNGKYPFRVFEIEQIEKFFSARGIDAWTGEELQHN